MLAIASLVFFFFSSRRRHTRLQGDWSSDVCSSDLLRGQLGVSPRRSVSPETPPQDEAKALWPLPRSGQRPAPDSPLTAAPPESRARPIGCRPHTPACAAASTWEQKDFAARNHGSWQPSE